MQTVNLGDGRLNKRLISLLNTLCNHPQESIPVACGGWAETKAAYRFFDNQNVSAEKILHPHRTATMERTKQQETVLLIQDTITYQEAYTSQQATSAYWLIRAITNRRLLDANDNLKNLKLIESVKSTQPIGIIEFELPARNKSE